MIPAACWDEINYKADDTATAYSPVTGYRTSVRLKPGWGGLMLAMPYVVGSWGLDPTCHGRE